MSKSSVSFLVVFFLTLAACNKNESPSERPREAGKDQTSDARPTQSAPKQGSSKPAPKAPAREGQSGAARPDDQSRTPRSTRARSSDPVINDLEERALRAVNDKTPLPEDLESRRFDCVSFFLVDGSKSRYEMRFSREGHYFVLRADTDFGGVTFIKSSDNTALVGKKQLYWRGFPTSNKWTMYFIAEKDGGFLGLTDHDGGPLIGASGYIDTCSAKSESLPGHPESGAPR